jgi:hypothetical protein
MIKVSELRIGNCVYDHEGDESKVYNVYNSGGVDLTFELVLMENINAESISPIPLTEEWLVKFGFEKYVNSFRKGYNDLVYHFIYLKHLDSYACYIEYEDDSELYPISFNIEYVHQLQNFYFALTGEELIIE